MSQQKSLNPEVVFLLEAMLLASDQEEMYSLLQDLLTQNEILEFAQRLDIARRLWNKESYKKIEEETWVSSTTIARVAKFLKGKHGGYRKIFWTR